MDEWSGGVSTESKVTLYVWKSREYVALESGVLARPVTGRSLRSLKLYTYKRLTLNFMLILRGLTELTATTDSGKT